MVRAGHGRGRNLNEDHKYLVLIPWSCHQLCVFHLINVLCHGHVVDGNGGIGQIKMRHSEVYAELERSVYAAGCCTGGRTENAALSTSKRTTRPALCSWLTTTLIIAFQQFAETHASSY